MDTAIYVLRPFRMQTTTPFKPPVLSTFFLHCRRYTNKRKRLLRELDFVTNLGVDILLYGDIIESHENYCLIFVVVYKYIMATDSVR